MIKNILLFIWQLPQNIAGLFTVLFTQAEFNPQLDVWVTGSEINVSLGKYIIVHNTYWQTINHEHGHQKQSQYLGWLYLFIIGIPSGLGCLIWTYIYQYDYFSTWWESWADKLGGVNR